MPNNKDDQKSGSQGAMSDDSNRDFENQGQQASGSGRSGHGEQAGGYGKGPGSQGDKEDDEMETAGGRQGNFSDANRGSEGQWSPGTSRSSDE